eukprot:CAMPEP_0174727334 /NCGR_PEP_ID=MMETSP1094-20130205/49581_1 /TAXON_ID=156173 /ORGANISM="Chrysochromulina brevifilum, Strain UTEX LB 985" /LENGTH=60 /DNA_ID=CAMNT_0015929053 /DNA_START=439 /DNA_END=621 /DNA_ORIENTATION=+
MNGPRGVVPGELLAIGDDHRIAAVTLLFKNGRRVGGVARAKGKDGNGLRRDLSALEEEAE